MNQDHQDALIVARQRQLKQERQHLMRLPPAKALERILAHAQPAALVHSLPEEDFYFLVNEIGPDDALPLLQLAADRQLEFLLDLESWQRDRIDLNATTQWLARLQRTDAVRWLRWVTRHKTQLFEFILFKSLEVRIREHDQDPSELGEDFETFDDVLYFRVPEAFLPHQAGRSQRKQLKSFFASALKRLADTDYDRFRSLLIESTTLIPAEIEEEEYRLRNVRLAEKGFLPQDEAIGVYQPLTPKQLHTQTPKAIDTSSRATSAGSLSPTEALLPDNLLSHALSLVDTAEVSEKIHAEFAGLCNQVISADQTVVRDREALRQVVKKACGYVSLGIDRMAREGHEGESAFPAHLIQNYPLASLFRVGYGRVLELKFQAQKWHRSSWAAQQGLPLTFWGETWLGVLGGLLLKKPLFFDNYATGALYREFYATEDISITDQTLRALRAFDDLLSLMDIHLGSLVQYKPLSYKNLIMTLWAQSHLKISEGPLRLTLEQLRTFLQDLFMDAAPDAQSTLRRINPALQENFLDWLATRSGTEVYMITSALGPTLEALFDELTTEYGHVAPQDLDPRFIPHFLLKKPPGLTGIAESDDG
jgi:hypothetical protein